MAAVPILQKIVETARTSPEDFFREIAVFLYKEQHVTLAQAARIAQMDRVAFQQLLASRSIDIHFTVDEYEHDVAVLKRVSSQLGLV